MQPMNYAIDVKNPFESAIQGLKTGVGIQETVTKQAEAQRQVQAQIQMQTDLASLASKKDASGSDYASMMVKYPQLSEHFKRGWDVLSGEQQQSKLNQATQVYASLQSGKPEIATQLLQEQAAALRNSGKEEDAKAAETMAKFIELDPDSAKTTSALMLSSVMGPEKFAETFTKLQGDQRSAELQPSAVSEQQSKAQKAAVDAKFAESNAALDLQKKGWDITKVQEDIKIAKQNASIAALNAQISRENSIRSSQVASQANQLKFQELQLKLQDMVQKRDETVAAKAADLESARMNMDNMLNTADRILKTPLGVIGSAAGPVSSRMPTLSQDTADFEALVETLGSQSFLAQIPNIKGMGALSNAEGEKLQAALQNFSLKQSPERLLENVREAQRLILKGRRNLTLKSGLPESVPDTPAVSTSGADVDALVKKYTQGAR